MPLICILWYSLENVIEDEYKIKLCSLDFISEVISALRSKTAAMLMCWMSGRVRVRA